MEKLTSVNKIIERRDLPFHKSSKIENKKRLGQTIRDTWTRWLNFSGSYKFIDRSKGSQRLIIIIAGYKDFLYPLTLKRIAKFAPSDVDVCVVSSGLYSASLAELAESYGWSYLYTKANKVSLVQNLAISVHPQAEWIYKLDEDVFISEGFFDSLLESYLRIQEEGLYLVHQMQ
jgi:hypothetical protein